MKKLFTERDIYNAAGEDKIILISKDDILTPSAKDKIKELGLKIVDKDEAEKISGIENLSKTFRVNKAALGSDHTGFRIKNILSKILVEKGIGVIDVGTYDEKSCDYPDFAHAVAKKVQSKEADFGILIDATGIPSAITANKLKGIRAATCYNEFSARSAREHNDANIIVIGAKTIGEETIISVLDVWLNTRFGGGRHQKRLDKITAIEDKN
ncbi:MAG TPA: ribose 5-phosphate isomerase B [Ignavibacteriaceae bacterium]|nr:ribose 5-phosphate isomerase B [Ignavibacteriaceae bacterium]